MSTTRTEEYIETIYEICTKKKIAKVSEIKEKLRLSSLASVTEMVQKLAEEGLINYEKYKGVSLSENGLVIAKRLSKKHKAIEDFLKIIGVNSNTADDDACSIEHVISEETFQAIKIFVEFMNNEKNKAMKEKIWTNYRDK